MWCCSSHAWSSTCWSLPTIMSDAVPRRALLWPTSLSLSVSWQLFARYVLSLSPIYIHNCKGSGTQLPTGSWSLTIITVCGGWMLILQLFGCCSYLLHARLTLCSGLLYWGCINAVARGSSVALSLYVWGLLSISTKASGYPFPSRSPLRWSSSACIVSRVIHRGKSRRPYPLSLGLSGERWSSGIGVWVAFL